LVRSSGFRVTHTETVRTTSTLPSPRCLICEETSGGWRFLCAHCGGQLVFADPYALELDAALDAGGTPLHAARTMGGGRLWLKDEGRNPTGSFKDRTSGMAVAAATAHGATGVAIYSCGNAGTAAAAAAARLGLRCLALVLPSISPVPAAHMRAFGAQLAPLDVDLSTIWTSGMIASLQDALWRDGGWFPLNRLSAPLQANPYYLAGAASMAAEIVQDLGEMPSCVTIPTGSGDLLLGLWLAFKCLARSSGAVPPRMVAVQADGAAPLVRSWKRGACHVEVISFAQTIASGIEIVAGSKEALAAVRESGGAAATVSDGEILETMRRLARDEGLLTSPEGAAAAAVATQLTAEREAGPIVAVLTATGMKYPALLPADLPAPCAADAASVLSAIEARPASTP
jgi:threonine synthase